MLHFDDFRSEVAVKMFRVLDEPLPERWLQIVAGLLVMLQAAPLEEVVKDEREKTEHEGWISIGTNYSLWSSKEECLKNELHGGPMPAGIAIAHVTWGEEELNAA
jgi:hypothetical protein